MKITNLISTLLVFLLVVNCVSAGACLSRMGFAEKYKSELIAKGFSEENAVAKLNLIYDANRASVSDSNLVAKVSAIPGIIKRPNLAGPSAALETAASVIQKNSLDSLLNGVEMPVAPQPLNIFPKEIPIGSQVGDYVVLDKLGSGGMGDVYLARSLEGKLVALKTIKLSNSVTKDSLAFELFKREAEILKTLNHPYIVKYESADTNSETPFIAQEYLKGKNLEEVLLSTSSKKLDVNTVTEYSLQMLYALKYLHNQGISHKDIKPSNMFITDEGEVKLIDFGIAGFDPELGDRFNSGSVGTPTFESPEQIKGDFATSDIYKMDMFSFGVSMYYLLSGSYPLPEPKNIWDLYSKHIFYKDSDLEILMKKNPSVPKELNDLVMSMLSRDPDNRPTAEQAIEKLISIQESSQTSLISKLTNAVENVLQSISGVQKVNPVQQSVNVNIVLSDVKAEAQKIADGVC